MPIGMAMVNTAHLAQQNIGKIAMAMVHGMKENIIMIGMATEVGQLCVIQMEMVYLIVKIIVTLMVMAYIV